MLWNKLLKFSAASVLAFTLYGCGKAPPIDICGIKSFDSEGNVVQLPMNEITFENTRALCILRDGSREVRDLRGLVDYLATPEDQAIDYYNWCNQK